MNARSLHHPFQPRLPYQTILRSRLHHAPQRSKLQSLRETLIQYAVDTQDHTVSDRFIELLRPRRPN